MLVITRIIESANFTGFCSFYAFTPEMVGRWIRIPVSVGTFLLMKQRRT
jgi:hypothetical protein